MKSCIDQFTILTNEQLNEINGEMSVFLAAAEVAKACYAVYRCGKQAASLSAIAAINKNSSI